MQLLDYRDVITEAWDWRCRFIIRRALRAKLTWGHTGCLLGCSHVCTCPDIAEGLKQSVPGTGRAPGEA